jgi:hypothetical protein
VTNLCDSCATELDSPLPFLAEQILSAWVRPLNGVLVDTWGRVHRLEAKTVVGRTPSARGLSILDGSVSRRHAELRRTADGWEVADLGSSNGTRVNDQPINGPTALKDKDRVTFGQVGFYFALDRDGLVEADASEVSSRTLRPGDAPAAKLVPAEPPEHGENTFAGLPSIQMKFLEAPSGGGGYLELAGQQLQLTDTQFAMLLTLARRMAGEAEVAPIVRGFVPSGQLIADLPWDTPNPGENHLKQLIRRVRALLDTVALGTLIESRRGFGYRLRAVPRMPFEPPVR